MFNNPASRILALALMMALLVKPCLGLITDWTADRAERPARSTIALDQAGEAPAPCKRICLNGRVEEVHAIARPVKAMLAGGPASAELRSDFWQLAPEPVAPTQRITASDVRTRLALLSRFLL